MFVVEHSAVELERRVGTEREVGIVGHYQPRRAFRDRCARFSSAQHAVADIDLTGCRSRDANDLILDDRRFTDTRPAREQNR